MFDWMKYLQLALKHQTSNFLNQIIWPTIMSYVCIFSKLHACCNLEFKCSLHNVHINTLAREFSNYARHLAVSNKIWMWKKNCTNNSMILQFICLLHWSSTYIIDRNSYQDNIEKKERNINPFLILPYLPPKYVYRRLTIWRTFIDNKSTGWLGPTPTWHEFTLLLHTFISMCVPYKNCTYFSMNMYCKI